MNPELVVDHYCDPSFFSSEDPVIVEGGAFKLACTRELVVRYGATVFAFEPGLEQFKEAERVKAELGSQCVIFLRNKALWVNNTTLPLYAFEGKRAPSTSLIERPEHAKVQSVETQDICELVSLHHLDLLALDVEGAENVLVEALVNSGDLSHVGQCSIECHPDLNGLTAEGMIELLARGGHKAEVLGGNKRRPILWSYRNG